MIEKHAFGDFVPKNAKYLMLGSFTAKKSDTDLSYDWFYCTKRNQFWSIIENVYGLSLPNKESKVKLFTKLGIAFSDMILTCERREDNSSDINLTNFVYNNDGITNILSDHNIRKVFFSSRFVEKEFKRKFIKLIADFPKVEFITLPSPSPRYAAMSKEEKIKKYKEAFPKNNIH
jgi:hypoxanthine-DNA glycosylase